MRKKSIKNIIILAIETSCDDTCIAILSIKGEKSKILSNIVSSQIEIHKKYGGVYPMMAKREHQRNLPIALRKALREAGFVNPKFQITNPKQIPNHKFQIPKIDFIAVTVGPGLEPCLWTGINFAKDLAKKWNLKIIPVNHIEGHMLINFQFSTFNFQKYLPAVCLVVSGGHTQLILMKDIGNYEILGETRDDAAGECFDKTSRVLGLGYPGGPAIASEATRIKNLKLKIKNFSLPRPMIYSKDYDFSFSGLKTATLYKFREMKEKNKNFIPVMAKEIQQAVIDVLIKKTLRAAKDYNAKTIILGGGVSANQELRKQLQKKIKKDLPQCRFLVPEPKFSTDNAVMIAITAFFNLNKAQNWKKIKVNANLKV